MKSGESLSRTPGTLRGLARFTAALALCHALAACSTVALAQAPSPDAGAGSSSPVRIRALLPGIGIEVTNTGTVTIEVRREIQVERLVAGAWQPLSVANLTLRPSCAIGPDHVLVDAPPCVALAPGATRTVPPWLVTVGDGQCVCERCGAAPPGPYRYVLHACSGDRLFVGEPFAPPFPAPRRAR